MRSLHMRSNYALRLPTTFDDIINNIRLCVLMQDRLDTRNHTNLPDVVVVVVDVVDVKALV